MAFYLSLFLIIWFMFFTVARFFQYYKIVKEYKDKTTAKIIRVRSHMPKNKKEKKALDVLLEYEINGKDGRAEIVVPQELSEEYTLDKVVPICYKVSGNGAVHIASDTDATKKLMYGHLFAFVAEFVAFMAIWWSMIS